MRGVREYRTLTQPVTWVLVAAEMVTIVFHRVRFGDARGRFDIVSSLLNFWFFGQVPHHVLPSLHVPSLHFAQRLLFRTRQRTSGVAGRGLLETSEAGVYIFDITRLVSPFHHREIVDRIWKCWTLSHINPVRVVFSNGKAKAGETGVVPRRLEGRAHGRSSS